MNIILPSSGGDSNLLAAVPLLPTGPLSPALRNHGHSRSRSLSQSQRSRQTPTTTTTTSAQGAVSGIAALSSPLSSTSPTSTSSSTSGTAAAASIGSGWTSIPLRLIQYGLSILLRIRARLPAPIRPWFWVGLWFMFAMVSVAIFAGFHTRIFELLQTMANIIKKLGRAGPPIIMVCLFLTAFPPIFGYSSLVTMSGYVYGFKLGLFIAYTSALLGSIACFYLCRKWFKVQVRSLMAKKPGLKSVVKAVEKKGFKLMILIRLAPYPFNVMNALLSATHIPLSTFALATALSLTKLALHVYIGSTLSSLAALPPGASPSYPAGDDQEGIEQPEGPLPDGDSHGRNLKIVVMVISMILGIAVGAYVWIVAKREIAASERTRIERRRKRRESMRQSRLFAHANANAVATAVDGTHRSHHQHQMVARLGSSDVLLNSLQQQHGAVPIMDLSGSDYVGAATLSINSNYRDEEDVAEDQALVPGETGSGRHSHSRSTSAARSPTSPSFQSNMHSHAHLEYGTDSDESEFQDDYDDDNDFSDMERGEDTIGMSSPLPPYPGNLQRTNSGGGSWQGNATEMAVRHPSPQPPVSSSSLSTSHPRSHNASSGWFAQNGVDTNDRGW